MRRRQRAHSEVLVFVGAALRPERKVVSACVRSRAPPLLRRPAKRQASQGDAELARLRQTSSFGLPSPALLGCARPFAR